MLIRFLSGHIYLLGNVLALALMVLILLPQTVPFGDDKEVEVKIYKATFLKWPFKPGNVEAVMGPCTEIITADDTIWEAQWERIYTDELDLVEVTWYIHVENDGILTLRLKRTRRLLLGWEWTKATLYETFKSLPGTMRSKSKVDVVEYLSKRYPTMAN